MFAIGDLHPVGWYEDGEWMGKLQVRGPKILSVWRTESPAAQAVSRLADLDVLKGCSRVYRLIGTMDAKSPLPALPDQKPTWPSASNVAHAWGLNQLGDRLDKKVRWSRMSRKWLLPSDEVALMAEVRKQRQFTPAHGKQRRRIDDLKREISLRSPSSAACDAVRTGTNASARLVWNSREPHIAC
jgi:hypothetical protein